MNLQPVKTTSLADKVFAQLLGEITSDRYPAGTKLPAERKLSEVFEVNRHVVREALKRLEQVGLIRISQGGSTEVLNFRESAGLDLLGLLADHAQGAAQMLRYWRSNLEMRAAIAPDVARLCALRASPELKASISALTKQMQTTEDDQALFALEVRYWDTLLVGADNLAYRLAFNSMIKSLRAVPETVHAWSLHEVRKSRCHQVLSEAIAQGDADTAELDTRALMRKGLQAFAQFAALLTTPNNPPAQQAQA
jgi:GntR family transcriptional repressor for pyruvate dehydrogenase complex